MSNKKYNIHDALEEKAQLWKEGKPDLLSDAALWQAVRYARSNTAKQKNLSDQAREHVNASYIENKADFLDTCSLKEMCRTCFVTFRSENLLICVGCSRERCGGCASELERNEHGDPVCSCGGIFV